MRRFYSVLSNSVFALQVLLLYLVIFESNLSLPPLVQTFGRLHPLLLHLPIGWLVLLALTPLLGRELPANALLGVQRFLLHLAALTTVLTALFGLFLAQEGGYGTALLWRHKWTGIGLSWLTYGLLLLNGYQPRRRRWLHIGIAATLLLTVVAGHFGANLTHGSNYLVEPLKKEEQKAITGESTVFEAVVAPILESKCYNCHNERKSKGDLVMTSVEGLLKGGENGPIWMAGDPENSALIQRLQLPLEDEEHMPPEGKPQLSATDLELLYQWIAAGADLTIKLKELSEEDRLYLAVAPRLEELEAEKQDPVRQYNFEAAPDQLVESLNTPFRTVLPSVANSPALHAAIFVRQAYEPAFLRELSEVKEQLVSLNLTNMPVSDADMSIIAQFANLEKLNLNGTDIKGNGLQKLVGLKNLRSLALSNTAVDGEISSILVKFSALEEIFLWNTKFKVADLEELEKSLSGVVIHRGYTPDAAEQLPLSPPLLVNKEVVLRRGEKVALKHNFPGVEIRYTTDGQEPDSLHAKSYDQPFELAGTGVIKAKAYRHGWLTSPLAEFTLFQAGLPVDSVFLALPPHPKYPGLGSTTLIDGQKGNKSNFRESGSWLGYQDTPLDAHFYLKKPMDQPVQRIVVSFLQQVGPHILPPASVEVWAGPGRNDLQLLKRMRPEPLQRSQPPQVKAIEIDVPAGLDYSCYRLVISPVKRLPAWHGSAGQKGWVFVDEVFFY